MGFLGLLPYAIKNLLINYNNLRIQKQPGVYHRKRQALHAPDPQRKAYRRRRPEGGRGSGGRGYDRREGGCVPRRSQAARRPAAPHL